MARLIRTLCFLLLASCLCVAQDAQSLLNQQFKDKVLFLRGFPTENKLAYDASGQPKKTLTTGPWTLSGMEIKNVSYKEGKVLLKGSRIATSYSPGEGQLKAGQQLKTSLIRLPSEIRVEIDAPSVEASALQLWRNTIFFKDTADLAASAPPEWQPTLRNEVKMVLDKGFPQLQAENSDWPEPQDGTTAISGSSGAIYKVGGEVSPPKPIYTPDPAYPEVGRGLRQNAVVDLQCIIDAAGHVSKIAIARPRGLGFDEQAVQAVRGWSFNPAIRSSNPVPVMLHVQVNFWLHN